MGLAVLDLAFDNIDADDTVLEDDSVSTASSSNGDLLLLSDADFGTGSAQSWSDDSLEHDDTDSDAVDSALADFAVGVLL